MSDTSYAAVGNTLFYKIADIVDDEWIADTLSDDGMLHFALRTSSIISVITCIVLYSVSNIVIVVYIE